MHDSSSLLYRPSPSRTMAIPAALLLISALGFIACKQAPPPKPHRAIVTFLKGKAEYRMGKQPWKALKVQDALKGAAEIRTSANATLDLLAANRIGVRLLGGSTFQLATLLSDKVNLDISGGNILVKVGKPRKGQELSVHTPTAIAGVRGTQFWGQVNPADKSGVFAVRQGKVSITLKGSKEQVELSAGEAVEYAPGGRDLKKRKAKPAEMGAMKQIDDIRMSAEK